MCVVAGCQFLEKLPTFQLRFNVAQLHVYLSRVCFPSINQSSPCMHFRDSSPSGFAAAFSQCKRPKLPPSRFHLRSVKRASLLPTRCQHVFSDLLLGLRRTFVPRTSERAGCGSGPPPEGTAASHVKEQLRCACVCVPLFVSGQSLHLNTLDHS